MSVIRRVDCPAGQTTPVIPPDGKDRSGQYHWTVINPASSVGTAEIVDAAAKTTGAGLPLAPGDQWDSMARGETVWAANGTGATITVIVTGTLYGD